MFDALSDRLGNTFDRLRGRGALREQDVRDAMREVRIALLEADVALPVARDFIEKVTEKAVGEAVLKSVTPGQQVVKIVNDELVAMLGGGDGEDGHVPLTLEAKPPVVIMMVGLQGSGKTTSTAKLAKLIREKVNPYARIIWGATTDDTMGDDIRVLLVLTGVKSEQIDGASRHTQIRNLRDRTVEFVN